MADLVDRIAEEDFATETRPPHIKELRGEGNKYTRLAVNYTHAGCTSGCIVGLLAVIYTVAVKQRCRDL